MLARTGPSTRLGNCHKPFCNSKRVHTCRSRSTCLVVRSSAENQQTTRRDLMMVAGATVLLAGSAEQASADEAVIPLVARGMIPKDKLSTFQRADQVAEYKKRAEAALGKVLTSADAASCVRLVLHDAATYDVETQSGGYDGSIVLPEELGRPENKDLASTVEKLAIAKAEIDAAAGAAGPISWADLMYLAGKVATTKLWVEIKLSKTTTESGGNVIAKTFGAEWPVYLGRKDSNQAGPSGRIPAADAPVEDIKAFLLTLGAKGAGPFTPKPPFWEKPGFVVWTGAAADPEAEEKRFAEADKVYADIKTKYDRSRNTLTRTDYEVDFITNYTKLSFLGAKFDVDAYLTDEVIFAPAKL